MNTTPAPATTLALRLYAQGAHSQTECAVTATRVVALAASIRRLTEHECNTNLTPRQ